ncbi:MAG: hypothetical protein FJZ90_18050, partial [Chloroflexi bacterium]|nr:hypothetical protein [Chloroflexota bacterium]
MDLQTATREELIQLIVEQRALIAKLRARIVALEGQNAVLKGELPEEEEEAGTATPAWVKPHRPTSEPRPRQKRAQGYGRKRS